VGMADDGYSVGARDANCRSAQENMPSAIMAIIPIERRRQHRIDAATGTGDRRRSAYAQGRALSRNPSARTRVLLISSLRISERATKNDSPPEWRDKPASKKPILLVDLQRLATRLRFRLRFAGAGIPCLPRRWPSCARAIKEGLVDYGRFGKKKRTRPQAVESINRPGAAREDVAAQPRG